MHINDIDLTMALPMFFVIMMVLLVVGVIVYSYVIKMDDKRPLMTEIVKVLEKPIQQGNIEWYVVECENGVRMKLRNLHANSIIIAVGDVGTVSFRGQTIETFERN